MKLIFPNKIKNPYEMLLMWLVLILLIAGAGTKSAYAQPGTPLRPKQAKPAELLIVAPQAFRASLVDYLRYKQAQMPTTLVTLESILKSTEGVDDPERLKRYLYNAWKTKHIGYVLLVGDADVMPVRYMTLDRVTPAAYDYAFYPSDLYYGDLAHEDGSFDDWNSHKDSFHYNYFGEVRGEKNKSDPINFDHISYHPKVAVGRWPVSTTDEVKLVAEKTMTYETGLQKGNKVERNKAALFAVGGWVDMRGQMDGFVSMLSPRWKTERYYYADAARRDGTPPPNEKQMIDLLNSGAGLVMHGGHGSDNTWDRCLSVINLDKLNNADRLPIMISAGCSTARFATLPPYEAYMDANGQTHKGTDAGEIFSSPPPPPACYQKGAFNPTGLGEQMLRHSRNGAVAYIDCNARGQPRVGFAKVRLI